MNYGIDWRSAEVRGGTLSVAVNGDLDFAFLKAFDMVLIEAGSEPSDRWDACRSPASGSWSPTFSPAPVATFARSSTGPSARPTSRRGRTWA